MTRKDFELIAEVLSAAMTAANLSDPTDKPTYSEGYRQAVKDMAETFAYRLQDTNPRFDTDRFLKAALNEGLFEMSAELHHAELEVVLRDQHDNIGYGHAAPTAEDVVDHITELIEQRLSAENWPSSEITMAVISSWSVVSHFLTHTGEEEE